MQHIQDKDLDQLFKSTFEPASVAPSRDLWKDIEQKLAPKKRTDFPFLWMAAASVVVLFTLTRLFTTDEKVQLQGMAAIPASVEQIVPSGEQPLAQPTALVVFKPAQTVEEFEKARSEKLRQLALKNAAIEAEPVAVLASTELKALPKPEPGVQQELPVKKEPVYIAAVDYDNVTSEIVDDEGGKRKGIRNVGDLVNFVVDKVDKRDRKAIRFKTNDDESSIVGVNIGFLKFNKRDK